MLNNLKKGEKVLCEDCKKGYIVPYGCNEDNINIEELDSTYYFVCTNCDWHMEICPSVTVE